ncbi:MAG TPA: hypothetical protein VMR33_06880 [Candidatus Baltobacteraceae bacterium]|jgi:hypothetical protein|nr:hypothetical protein [Candidatus Baltobacteraceae bacterium]
MKQRPRQSLGDTLLVCGLLLSFVGLFGMACFEAFKVFAVVPAAFDSSPFVWSNPMSASDGDYQANQPGGATMTAHQRAQSRQGGN